MATDESAQSDLGEETLESHSADEAVNVGSIGPSAAELLERQQDQQMAELRQLTEATKALLGTVEASKAQSVRNTRFLDALDSLNNAAQAVALAATTGTGNATGGAVEPKPVPGRDCDDCSGGPCECIATGCCCFEIVLDRVRAIQPQLEPADSGDIVGLHNRLECRIFASIDGIGIVVPNLASTMDLSVGSIALGGKPGLWVSVDRVIGRQCLPKGTSRPVEVEFIAGEIDQGVERPIGLKDEYGYASGSITLDCCVAKIYPSMPTDLSFEHEGTGGGVPGMISLAFYARRVCC